MVQNQKIFYISFRVIFGHYCLGFAFGGALGVGVYGYWDIEISSQI